MIYFFSIFKIICYIANYYLLFKSLFNIVIYVNIAFCLYSSFIIFREKGFIIFINFIIFRFYIFITFNSLFFDIVMRKFQDFSGLSRIFSRFQQEKCRASNNLLRCIVTYIIKKRYLQIFC